MTMTDSKLQDRLAAALDPARRSWIETANDPDADFPIQNLPFGVFTRPDHEVPRVGVAIGDQVLDMAAAGDCGLLGELPAHVRASFDRRNLNDFMDLGRQAWQLTRVVVADLLDAENSSLRTDDAARAICLVSASDATMCMPVMIRDYTDFYASLHHATNVGSMFRPDNPLMPNWLHLPVGYHGRASSIVTSGTQIRRPRGQTMPPDAEHPVFGPSRLLDYELEVGFVIGTPSDMGEPVPVEQALDHVFGMVIVNDWSSRDVQKWEYQPLGPFNSKNFATSISPWIVTLEALQPFMIPGPPRSDEHPEQLDYLDHEDDRAIDLELEVLISSEKMRADGNEPMRISIGNYKHMHWSMSQMIAHHTSTGCNLATGDMMASGTVSGPEEESRGCLLERTWRGEHPIELTDGTERKFLRDMDEVIMRGWCSRDGATRIGFGECTGMILPAAEQS